jgi:Acyl-coenzyme A:6-aminopenicillanic acid acyl-transferase
MIEVDTILAGGPADFSEPRRLVLSGSHQEIGRHLASIAAERYGWLASPVHDPARVRARKAWFAEHWPAHAARMRGAALACGLAYEDDTFDLGEVPYLMSLGACSASWHPPKHTSDGQGRLSRNYDFSTGTLGEFIAAFEANGASMSPAPLRAPGQLPMTARPYVIESYPDSGYATLQVRSYDLLGGCLDGINSAGLAVALLADLDAAGKTPTMALQAGINELEVPCYLLETCANVDEALERLAGLEHYAATLPCHYVIADRTGASFVWEPFTAKGARTVSGGGKPQVVTNHELTRFPSVVDLPDEAGDGLTYQRMRALTERIGDRVLTTVEIADAAAAVRFPVTQEGREVRTLWNSQYDVDALTLDITFYLGDEGSALRYSPVQTLRLDGTRVLNLA